MSIDGITFIAQIVNLAILVFLLYKFLFKPLLAAIDKREATIADELQRAAETEEMAKKRLAELNKKHEEIDQERKSILFKAHEDADALRLSLEADARESAEKTREKWKKELDQERVSLESEMRDLVITNFRNFAQKALEELADITLEEQIISVFKRQFLELDATEKERMTPKDISEEGLSDAFFTTAFALSSSAKQALEELVGIKDIGFKIEPNLACGIELFVEGQVLAWSMESYLKDFVESLKTSLDEISQRLSVPEK